MIRLRTIAFAIGLTLACAPLHAQLRIGGFELRGMGKIYEKTCTGAAAGIAVLCDDSVGHNLQLSNNNGGFNDLLFNGYASAATLTSLNLSGQAVTPGTMTVTNSATVKTVLHRFDWTNAMVTALGAVLAGDVSVCALPAKTVVRNAYVVITSAAGGVTTLTVSLGAANESPTSYILASDAKAASNTIYGVTAGQRGASMTGFDMPQFTGSVGVNAHFISTGTNLNTVTTSTGSVYLETETLP